MFLTAEDQPYRNLSSKKRTPTREPAPAGISRVRRNVALGPSPDLLGSIFNGITTQARSGRTYARLFMDDSGRWHVARTADTDKALPGDER